jgi:hypothetical protein
MNDLSEITAIEYSDTASVIRPDGTWYSAFQAGTYIARVVFEDGCIVCVCLPPGAAVVGSGSDFDTDVKATARAAHFPGGQIVVDLQISDEFS